MRLAVAAAVAVFPLLIGPALAFKGWDQDACMKEGNSAEVCTCTEKHVMERLGAMFPAEVVAAFDKDGIDGVIPLLSIEEQTKFTFEGLVTAMAESTKVCDYRDDPNVN